MYRWAIWFKAKWNSGEILNCCPSTWGTVETSSQQHGFGTTLMTRWHTRNRNNKVISPSKSQPGLNMSSGKRVLVGKVQMWVIGSNSWIFYTKVIGHFCPTPGEESTEKWLPYHQEFARSNPNGAMARSIESKTGLCSQGGNSSIASLLSITATLKNHRHLLGHAYRRECIVLFSLGVDRVLGRTLMSHVQQFEILWLAGLLYLGGSMWPTLHSHSWLFYLFGCCFVIGESCLFGWELATS